MTSTSQEKNMTRTVCNPSGKCSNCYYYGAPCLNCMDDLLSPVAEMTYEEYKTSSSTDKTYEQFCKEVEEYRKEHPDVFTDKSSPEYKEYLINLINKSEFINRYDNNYDVCIGPYNELFTRCFGPCCN